MTKAISICWIVFLSLISLTGVAGTSVYSVKSLDEFLAAESKAIAGDTITWAAGTFQNINLVISKDGLNIKAKRPGATIFTGTNGKVNRNSEEFFQPEKRISEGKMSAPPSILELPELNDDPQIVLDIAGNKRPGKTKSAGSFEPSRKANPVKPPATAQNTGPDYLRKSDGLTQQVIDHIRTETIARANQLMKEKPVTVTVSSCKRSAGGKNDFYFEGIQNPRWEIPEKGNGIHLPVYG